LIVYTAKSPVCPVIVFASVKIDYWKFIHFEEDNPSIVALDSL